MKTISETFFSKSFVLLATVFTLFLVGAVSDTILYAGAKKEKHHKKKTVKKKYAQLKDDYHYTVANFIVILEDLVSKSDELEKRIQKMEAKSLRHDQKLVNIRDYLYAKSLDPTYCPFDMFKKWYEEPKHFKDDSDNDRHILGEDFTSS